MLQEVLKEVREKRRGFRSYELPMPEVETTQEVVNSARANASTQQQEFAQVVIELSNRVQKVGKLEDHLVNIVLHKSVAANGDPKNYCPIRVVVESNLFKGRNGGTARPQKVTFGDVHMKT
jgi:hypothetical protein